MCGAILKMSCSNMYILFFYARKPQRIVPNGRCNTVAVGMVTYIFYTCAFIFNGAPATLSLCHVICFSNVLFETSIYIIIIIILLSYCPYYIMYYIYVPSSATTDDDDITCRDKIYKHVQKIKQYIIIYCYAEYPTWTTS